MLRKTSLLLNSIVVLLSLVLFAYTFFARTHLVGHTREYVTEKTLSYSGPLVEVMRASLDARLSKMLISQELRSQIEEELRLYDSDRTGYVTSLTAERESSFGTGKMAEFKLKIRNHYQSTLDALVRDLRIFSLSNVVAGLFAMWLLLTREFKRNNKVIAFSFVVFVAVAYSTFSYIDGVSFLRILLKSHLGWWYPAGIAMTVWGLVLEHGLHKDKDDEPAPSPKA